MNTWMSTWNTVSCSSAWNSTSLIFLMMSDFHDREGTREDWEVNKDLCFRGWVSQGVQWLFCFCYTFCVMLGYSPGICHQKTQKEISYSIRSWLEVSRAGSVSEQGLVTKNNKDHSNKSILLMAIFFKKFRMFCMCSLLPLLTEVA